MPAAAQRLYGHGVSYRYWPLFDLRLSTPDLRLRPMTEADLAPIADLLPDDVERRLPPVVRPARAMTCRLAGRSMVSPAITAAPGGQPWNRKRQPVPPP